VNALRKSNLLGLSLVEHQRHHMRLGLALHGEQVKLGSDPNYQHYYLLR
jgi:hypothetical protein